MTGLRAGLRARLGAGAQPGTLPPPPSSVLELEVKGPAALQREGVADPGALRIAAIVPSFRRGSGGHRTIVRILDELARRGHTVSAWLEDGEGRHAQEPADVTKRSFEQFFAAERVPLEVSWEHWTGADVVLATGWQTVARALLLPRCRGRAYLVQDHEPEFYGTSAEALWAAESYRRGLHCIAASEWLAGLLRSRYGASASHFDLGVEPSEYRAIAGARREDLVVFYARAVTPRRAVPLGMLGLEELARRRPGVEIALYGEDRGLRASFPYRDAGVLDASDLAGLYAQATVGMVLSLTNPSLVNLEMMACGLPCVELASESMLGTFGDGGPLQLSAPEPLALCAAIETLLDDPARRRSLASEGIALAGRRGWPRAAEQVEEGLRLACGVGPSAPEPA